MAKKFLDVFPDLHMTEEMKGLMSMVDVEKVSTPRDRSALRIYIVSSRLIHKKNIYALETGIREQLFPGKKLSIKIMEKYRLSGQYTPEKLLQVYRDSLLLELKNYSIIEYNIFRKTNFSFPNPEVLHMTVEDTMVNREKSGELKRVLEKVFHERCGLPMEVEYEYVVPQPDRKKALKEAQMQREVMEIARRSAVGDEAEVPFEEGAAVPHAQGEEKPSAPESDKKKKAEAAPAGKMAGRQGFKKGFQDGKKEFRRTYRKADNPDVLYGRDFEDDGMIEIDKIDGEIGEVVLRGKIIAKDLRELRSGRTLVIFDVTDFTDTMTIKMFPREDMLDDVKAAVSEGSFIKVKGVTTIDKFDGELTLGSVVGIKKCEDFTGKRSDNSLEKRVELHCHTKMSDMDGVSEVKDIIKRAKKWGMPAIAVTDHGCVQSFPDANHALDKGDTFKVLYGVEGYLVDDVKEMVENQRGQSFEDTYVVFDLETTGLSPEKNRIIEIGAVKVKEGQITDRFSTFVNPDVPIPFEIEKLTGINDNMVLPAPTIEEALPDFLDFCGDAVLVGHNASFDVSFIAHNCARQKIPFSPTVVDTVSLAQMLMPNLNRFKLDTVAKALNISLENHHRAVDDAGATAEIFVKFVKMMKERDIHDLAELNRAGRMSKDTIKKMPTYHVIILAKNDIGRVNLYRLISFSHIEYFARRPRIPKSLLTKYREADYRLCL